MSSLLPALDNLGSYFDCQNSFLDKIKRAQPAFLGTPFTFPGLGANTLILPADNTRVSVLLSTDAGTATILYGAPGSEIAFLHLSANGGPVLLDIERYPNLVQGDISANNAALTNVYAFVHRLAF